ncbi:hypothetical protein RHMOL_Rhmol02G0123300 [Rhododendron molle]|uniref:Uncharacterized protein n=1 Tax=Rhododendron molle TaxID=49168 RepID=A0ACC0PP03_RHOML|nr:hypothetical protein RHMOL_Rhmol02G0123300 [Rhododendron molle]
MKFLAIAGEVFQCRVGTGHVVPSTILTVQTCFGRPRFVWVILKCKIIKTPPQAGLLLGRIFLKNFVKLLLVGVFYNFGKTLLSFFVILLGLIILIDERN